VSLTKRVLVDQAAADGLGTAGVEEGRERVSEIQRARIVAAMVSTASEHGVGYATVARVVARSGVSRRTFYEQFVDREDCFLTAFDQAIGGIAAVVLPAYRVPSKWHERVRAGLAALLQCLDGEPAVARLVIVEALGAGPKALEHRRRGIAQIVTVIDTEGREAKGGEGPPPLTAEGVVGGALSLIHARLAFPPPVVDRASPTGGGEGDSLIGLLNPLVSMIVLPYLGATAARRELERPAPVTSNGAHRVGVDPLRELDMRLTYRTVRVLLAIGELTGLRGSKPSNREVGDVAGIRDQGQVSKLLARLQQLGLVANARESQAKGAPNAWALTKRGAEVHEVLSV
jgi:AcrR family transcriptional regulator